jgi:hypothetical protein
MHKGDVTNVIDLRTPLRDPCKHDLSASIYLRMTAGSNSPPITATPILDSGARPKRRAGSRVGNTIFGVLLGVPFATLLIQSLNRASDVRNPAADFVFAFYVLSFVLAVVVHEVGHLLAGWIVGFRFSSISLGPLSLKIEYGKLKLRLVRTIPAAGYAGMHIDRVRRLLRRLLVFTVAGPLANLLSAAGAALLTEIFLSASRSWLYFPSQIFLGISLIIGFSNLVPFRLGMLYTDGARIAMLLSSRPRSRRWICTMALANQSQKGARSRRLRQTWVQAASSLPDGSIDDFAGNWIAYLSANDRKIAPVAALHLERCLALMNLLGPTTQDLATLEAAVFTAWFRKDAVTAQKWLQQVRKFKAIPPLLRIRADVALPCARMEFDQALSVWQRGIDFVVALPISPERKRLKNGWMEWHAEIRERQLEMANKAALIEAPSASS